MPVLRLITRVRTRPLLLRDSMAGGQRWATKTGHSETGRERRQQRRTAGGRACGGPASDHRDCELAKAEGVFRHAPWILRLDFKMQPLVRTAGISKHYPSGETIVRAVSNVSLSIEHGEFVAIRGRSGSGKSTLMNLLGLLDRPDCGEYVLNDREVAKLSEDSTRGHQEPRHRLHIPTTGPSAARNRAGKCRTSACLRRHSSLQTTSRSQRRA